MNKTCSRCGETKDVTEFYKDKRTKDGISRRCGECQRFLTKRWADKNKDHVKEYNRQYHEENRDAILKRKMKYNETYYKEHYYGTPKAKAHSRMSFAVTMGRLPKVSDTTCDKCGAPANERHHLNYEKDLYVNLCYSCHGRVHSVECTEQEMKQLSMMGKYLGSDHG